MAARVSGIRSINVLAFYHECRLLIGYVRSVAVVIKMTAGSLRFRSICEED